MLLVLAAAGLVVGFTFAGSPSRLAQGVRIAGVDVGGLPAADARRLLERRSRRLAEVPVLFRAGSQRFPIRPAALGVELDWKSAVASAQREGDGFGPIRGFRRLGVSFFGANITPSIRAYDPALRYELGQLAQAAGRPHREASLVLKGLRPVIVPGQAGRVLDRKAAADLLVHSLASYTRRTVWLPFRVDPVRVTAASLRPAAARVRLALSAPVRLAIGPGRYLLPRRRLARMLELPSGGSRALRIRGPEADAYLAGIAKAVQRPPVDASFEVIPGGIRIVPSVNGRKLDVAATERAILRAALSRTNRVARIAVVAKEADRTTADARAMGITGVVSSYETIYGGIPNRIHNVQLVARLIDDHLIAPGQEFSFNNTTGERTADKGFLEAPVIINGELATGLGGGVCQVSTTVFNSAYEAGLKISQRTNHGLYISHYPQGRDATVDYPGIDLRFVNDTGHWLLLRTFVGSSSLTVNLYGTPTHRRVESETGSLRVTGGPPVRKINDPTLEKGETKVEEYGSPARATSAHRRVYAEDGKLLHDDVWYSSYRGEIEVLRVGTKPPPKPVKPPKPTKPPNFQVGPVIALR